MASGLKAANLTRSSDAKKLKNSKSREKIVEFFQKVVSENHGFYAFCNRLNEIQPLTVDVQNVLTATTDPVMPVDDEGDAESNAGKRPGPPIELPPAKRTRADGLPWSKENLSLIPEHAEKYEAMMERPVTQAVASITDKVDLFGELIQNIHQTASMSGMNEQTAKEMAARVELLESLLKEIAK